MKQKLIILFFLLEGYDSYTQNVSKIEYFFNVDPGFNNGTNILFIADTNIVNLPFNADLSSLSTGLHTMYIRSMDANGKWSLTCNQNIYKFPPPVVGSVNPLPLITKLEYFYNIDPGFSNGFNIPVVSDTNLNAVAFNADLSSLSPGIHALYIRSKDANGNWSHTSNQNIYKFPQPSTGSSGPLPLITKLEYFYDTDPGFNNGFDIPVVSDTNLNSVVFNADLSSLSPGIHALYIRSKDANGKWSHTSNQNIYKFPQPATGSTGPLPLITKLEYFYDTDPGFSNGFDIPIVSDTNLNSVVFNADLSSLSPGIHALYIRSKDANGKWSLTSNQNIYKFPVPTSGTNDPLYLITKLEYFFNTDPGFNNGFDIPVVSDTNLNAVMFNADLSTLNPGLHSMYVRSMNANGKWSLTSNQFIYKFPQASTVAAGPKPNIIKLEYFINTDPGFGNGTDITISSDSNLSNAAFFVDTTGLPLGNHSLYVRSMDANGKWSQTEVISIHNCGAATITEPIISGNTVYCTGQNLNLSVTPVLGALGYIWKGPNSFYATGLSVNIPNLSNANAGIYTVKAYGSGGSSCDSSLSQPIAVYVMSPIIFFGDIHGCTGIPIPLIAYPSGGSFSVPNPYVGPSTSYTYTYTDTTGCTITTTPANIIVHNAPTATISGGGYICPGTILPNVYIHFYGEGPWNLTYSNGTSVTTLNGINTSTYIIPNAPIGNYTIVSVSNNYCTGTSSGQAIVALNTTLANQHIDFGVSHIDHPVSDCGLSSAETITVKIKNYGNTCQTGFAISYSINGGSLITESNTSIVIPQDSSVVYSFNNTANLSATGLYIIRVYTSVTGDTTHQNDTLLTTIHHYPTLLTPGNLSPLNNSINIAYPIYFTWNNVPNAQTYDFYLWKFTDPMPTVATFPNLTQINYPYLMQNLIYGAKYNWKIVAKVNNCETSSSIQNFTMRKLPDLKIDTIFVPPSATSQASFSTSWKTINNGPGKTINGWSERVYLSESKTLGISNDILLGTYANVSALDSGQHYTSPLKTFTLPLGIQGNHYVIVIVDVFSSVIETNEANNNHSSDTMVIALAPPPDLQVPELAVTPSTVFTNTNLSLTYKVKNLGLGPTSIQYWYDGIYFDTNAIFNMNNTLLLSDHYHTGYMSALDSYIVIKNVLIPNQISGTYYIHIFTDRQNSLFEYSNENNNSITSIPISVVQSPTADLTVISVSTMFDTLSNGQLFATNWTSKNNGAVAANPDWIDALIFCADSVLGFSPSYYYGISFQDDVIPSLTTKVNYLSRNVPQNITQGYYYLFAQTDIGNQIFESIFENNNTKRKTFPIYIANADLHPISFNVPSAGLSGENISVSWRCKNLGHGAVIGVDWDDAVYLSTDNILNSNDILLGTQHNSFYFPHNNEYVRNATFNLPVSLIGNFYLIFKTNYQNSVLETNLNNNTTFAPINLTLAPWPDLQVASFQVPAAVTGGTTISFNTTITNFGVGNTLNANCTDKVYISPSSNFNNPAKNLLLSYPRQYSLPQGQSLNLSGNVDIPTNLSAGQYYLFYVVDANNDIFENTSEGNNYLVSNATILSVPTIAFNYIDLAAFTAKVDTNHFIAGQTVSIEWEGKNVGLFDANPNSWNDAVYLSTDTNLDAGDILLGTWLKNPPLLKDSMYTQMKSIVIPNSAFGTYYLIVEIDKNNNQADTLRANNKRVLSAAPNGNGAITISLPPPSDLIPTSFVSPTAAIASQPITVSYSIKNNGIGTTAGGIWFDRLYISTDNILDANDISIGTFNHTDSLFPSAQYSETKEVFIPSYLTGNYFLLLKTDDNNNIYEHQHENNNVALGSINISSQQPSDLIASNVMIPSGTILSGQIINLEWTIINEGTNAAQGFFRDGIYISADSTWDTNDILLGIYNHNTTILPNDSIITSTSIPLNNVGVGNYFIIIKTDILNNIVESVESNNTGISDTTLLIDMKELMMDSLTIDTIINNAQLYYKIIVPASLANETMKLTLKGDTANHAVNKLFLSYNTTPSSNIFDFSSELAFSANQEIIVPQLQAGTYYLMSLGSDTATTHQPITLLAKIIPFSITSVYANQGGNTGGVTIQINGAKFSNSTIFGLVDSQNNFIPTYSTFFSNETKVFAGFNLLNVNLGFYDVIAINTQGDTVKLIDGFEVVQGLGAYTSGGGSGAAAGFLCQIVNIGFENGLETQYFHQATTRPNRVLSVIIYYENKGLVDIPTPIRFLVSLGGAPVAFTAEALTNDEKDLKLEFIEQGGPPDVLRPGASGFIKIYTKSVAPIELAIAH